MWIWHGCSWGVEGTKRKYRGDIAIADTSVAIIARGTDGKVAITEDVRSKTHLQLDIPLVITPNMPNTSSTQPPVADVHHCRRSAIEWVMMDVPLDLSGWGNEL